MWKPLFSFPGYEINDIGQIRSLDRVVNGRWKKGYFCKGKELKDHIDVDGYRVICLTIQGRHYNLFVHRLVALTFIDNPFNLPQVNHLNGVKTDCSLSNLEWCSAEANQDHKNKFLRKSASKELYVHFKKAAKKWYLLIPIGKQRKFFGYYESEKRAIEEKARLINN